MTAVLLECSCKHGILIATRAQSNPQPKGVWTSLRGHLRSAAVRAEQTSTGRLAPPVYPEERNLRLEDKKNEQRKIRKGRAECPDYCPTDVGRILRTFKIKKNVEVTDNGKDDF